MDYTLHAQKRLRQRGLYPADIDLVLVHGTETRDGYYLRERDIDHAKEQIKKLLDRLDRLAGTYVVMKNDKIITAYHPSRKKEKRILRQ